MKIIKIRKTTSTNDYILKYIKKRENTIVVAEEQTLGRGTKGRSFSANKGGIYLSFLRFYDKLKAESSYEIIIDIAVAVVKTLRAFEIEAMIKWPNDIYYQNKKLCGILTENKINDGKIDYSVIGIGLNVKNELPEELKHIATSMSQINKKIEFNEVLATLIFNLQQSSTYEEYLKFSCVINRKVTVIQGEKEFEGVVKEILRDGRLLLADNQVLSAAEIKLKI